MDKAVEAQMDSHQKERPQTERPRTGKRRVKPVYMHRNREVDIPDGYMAVGQIVGVHGLRGEVKVELHTDFPERFKPGLILAMGIERQEVEVASARPHKGLILVRLVGVNQRSAAETLRGNWLFVSEEAAMELDEGIYWIHDLIGLTVQSTSGEKYGTLIEVLSTGANDVYIVRTEAPFNKGKDLLIPAIAEVVQTVDLEAGLMSIDLPAGLVEE
jgi:16S rRNA processing protein RimM